MMGCNEPLNAWQWLDERHWMYLPFWDSYQSPCGKFFITTTTIYRMPGDVIYYLKTGHVRTIQIFDSGLHTPDPKELGFRVHKDGTCVALRKVK